MAPWRAVKSLRDATKESVAAEYSFTSPSGSASKMDAPFPEGASADCSEANRLTQIPRLGSVAAVREPRSITAGPTEASQPMHALAPPLALAPGVWRTTASVEAFDSAIDRAYCPNGSGIVAVCCKAFRSYTLAICALSCPTMRYLWSMLKAMRVGVVAVRSAATWL